VLQDITTWPEKDTKPPICEAIRFIISLPPAKAHSLISLLANRRVFTRLGETPSKTHQLWRSHRDHAPRMIMELRPYQTWPSTAPLFFFLEHAGELHIIIIKRHHCFLLTSLKMFFIYYFYSVEFSISISNLWVTSFCAYIFHFFWKYEIVRQNARYWNWSRFSFFNTKARNSPVTFKNKSDFCLHKFIYFH
jgi:hypothetical protein